MFAASQNNHAICKTICRAEACERKATGSEGMGRVRSSTGEHAGESHPSAGQRDRLRGGDHGRNFGDLHLVQRAS